MSAIAAETLSIVLAVVLAVSETLPFIKTCNAQGILHGISIAIGQIIPIINNTKARKPPVADTETGTEIGTVIGVNNNA